MRPIGIDLGTTFSAVATLDENGRPVIVPNADGEHTTPSVVYFPESGEPIVGAEAKEQQLAGETEVASFFKSRMGNGEWHATFRGKVYDATALSALVLKKLKADAEASLGERVEKAVITVPAYFNEFQRNATIEAARRAGLGVLRIINEPTSASLAYGVATAGRNTGTKTLMVYDLGGGTFDVSIVRVDRGQITVVATDGNHDLGGGKWDNRIADYLAERFNEEYGVDPRDDRESLNDLQAHCEKAKRELSVRASTKISITHGGSVGRYELTRDAFEAQTRGLLEETELLCEKVLRETSGVTWQTLDGVLLVGGSTRMPMVSAYVERMTGRKPFIGVNQDEAVALGAALQAASDLQNEGEFELEGTGCGGGDFSLPTITDVTSHSLGMVAENGDRSKYVNSILIAKNSTIPKTETKPYALRVGRDRSRNKMEVYMLQGEDGDPLACDILGKYVISDIEPVSGGKATLEVGFSYNKNGTVDVTAVQRDTGRGLPVTKEPVPEDKSWLSRSPKENDKNTVKMNVSVVIAVDTSGSMDGHPLREAQKAARQLVAKLDLQQFSVGIMSFNDDNDCVVACCNDARKIDRAIGYLPKFSGGTSAVPFRTAMSMMKDDAEKKFVIVLTDGEWFSPEPAIADASRLKEEGVEIIAIGFGEADYNFLRRIASCDENALMTDLSNLVESFSTIGQVLAEGGGSASLTMADEETGKLHRGFFGWLKGE